jgi:hypothetical protein
VTAEAPPTFIAHSTADEALPAADHADRLHAALLAHGVPPVPSYSRPWELSLLPGNPFTPPPPLPPPRGRRAVGVRAGGLRRARVRPGRGVGAALPRMARGTPVGEPQGRGGGLHL